MLPAPLKSTAAPTEVSTSRGDESSPSIAVNKNNPLQMVAVWTRNDPALPAPTRIVVEGKYTINGGQTWTNLPGLGGVLTDPTSTATPPIDYAEVTDVSVAFDRDNNFYVLSLQHTSSIGPNAPNALVLNGYTISGNVVAQKAGVVNKVIYQSTQDRAITPMLAVDDSVRVANSDPAYDQSNPYSGNIYVAWATNDQPQQNATNFNANRVLMIASSDGGVNFSGPVVVNSNGNSGGTGTQRAAAPRLAISQGRPATPTQAAIPAGQVTVVYDDFNTQATASPPRDVIRSVTYSPAATQSVAGGNGPINPGQNNYQASVTINNLNFETLSDLTVSVALTQAQVSDLRIELIGPGGLTIVLTPNGGSAAGGASGANLGVSANGQVGPTVFSDSGVSGRLIGNAGSTAPYMGYYRPQGGNLRSIFGGMSAATLNNSTWTLRITNSGTAVGNLRSWGLNFTSGMARIVERQVATTTVRGAVTSPYPRAAAVTGEGIGPAPVIASDNTLGAFSPYQGRLYVAFVDRIDNTFNPADNTDIFLAYSDDGGQSWIRQFNQVNDDLGARDGFSEATNNLSPSGTVTGRPQFQPEIQVDQTTGTLVLSWLDARHDAARARTTTYIAASSDGGQTYAPQVYANRSQTAIDALTRKEVVLGPIPDNQSSGNPNTDGTFGFGTRQGLAVFGGRIYPIWAGNENSVDDVNGLEELNIRTTVLTIAGGPRIIDSTMGVVGLSGDFVNPASPTGSPTVQSFLVTFDRPIDADSFLTSLVTIFFKSPTGEEEKISATGVVRLSDTQFQVNFAPQTRVGTYSYYIKPEIKDRIRTPGTASTPASSGNYMDQNANGVGNEQLNGYGDLYSTPGPQDPSSVTWNPNASPDSYVPAPFDQDTLPLILPGPHLAGSSVPGAPTTGDNLVTDSGVSAIDVVFDRDMDPSSFTPESILRLMGPSGLLTVPFTIEPNPNGTDPNPAFPRTYRIKFPEQKLSGTYSLQLAATIKSAAGDMLDSNYNAGVDVLKQTASSPDGQVIPVTYNTQGFQNNVTILPQQTVTSTITIPDSFLAKNVTVGLNINYQFNPDLEVRLVAPNDEYIVLFSGIGSTGTQANFTNTIFDDAAPMPIQNGGPPFFGRYQPQFGALRDFEDNGPSDPAVNVNGTWRLEITSSAEVSTNRTGTLVNWSISFSKAVPSTGLGEPVADQATTSFRIFTNSATNPQASNTWTQLGPGSTTAPTSNGEAGQVGAIAVDPSDPSGNTVYVAGSSGGIWKTTNFLTTSPNGPTYVPLTDFGPAFGMNIGGIAVFPRNNDPNQSIIIAGTGFADARAANGNTIGGNTTRGVGFLRSMDGGASWTLLDSTNNNLPFSGSQFQRDHLFAQAGANNEGTSTYKVVVDPRPTVDGKVIVYAAMAGVNGGLWRSLDTGQTWQKLSNDAVHGTTATDISLNLNSAIVNAVSNPTGNVNVINVAFQGVGVFISPNRGQTLNQMVGNGFSPLTRDPSYTPPSPILIGGGTFPSNPGRIILARPDPLPGTRPTDANNVILEGWLYAAVADQNGGFLGLYQTKDNGTTWTRLQTKYQPVNSLRMATPSNDPNKSDFTPTTSRGLPDSSNYNITLAIDPTNPNIVYLGGSGLNEQSGLIRVDATNVYDSHSVVAFDGSRPDGGLLQIRTTGRAQVKVITDGLPTTNFYFDTDPQTGLVRRTPFINVIQDPGSPYATDATVYVTNVRSQASGGTGFTNDGSGVTWTPFDSLLVSSSGLHRVISIFDPLTGHARLIFGNDQGVFTGVDDNGSLRLGIGDSQSPNYSRSGNLAISQFYYGAVHSNNLTADIAGALAYGNGVHTGLRASDANVLQPGAPGYGSDDWRFLNDAFNGGIGGEITGVGVQAGQQSGRSIVYQYLFPGLGGNFTNFFQVSVNGGPFISRTTGLVQTSGGTDTQWTDGQMYANGLTQGNFTVNPINDQQVVISSNAGRIFSTINEGRSWLVIAEPGVLDSTYASALTFGAPDPSAPGGIGNLNNFIYAGTVGGKVFVTRTGGGSAGGGNAWTDISTGLDGSPLMKIITNPTRGSHEAYAITQRGVYHTEDSLSSGAGTVWTNVTGNLFSLVHAAFGNSSLSDFRTSYLTSIVADWRYVIPDDPTNPNSTTHPVLYVAGEGGVYRSFDDGQTWAVFPNISFDNSPTDGGYLPTVHVTDLNMTIGAVDPTNGRAVATAGDPNHLVATTYGRGSFSIRLAPIVFGNTPQQPNTIYLAPAEAAGQTSAGVPMVSKSVANPLINGFSEQTAFGNRVLITLYDLTDVSDPSLAPIIGGYDPSRPSTNIAANETDSFGKYAIRINAASFQNNGLKTIGIRATDGSGTTSSITTFQFLLQADDLGLPGNPTKPTLALAPADDTSNGQKITRNTQPRIVGQTDHFSTVELFRVVGGVPEATPLATGTTDSTGTYSLRFPSTLADGTYTVMVRVTRTFVDPANPDGPPLSFSTDSDPYDFQVDTVGPTVLPTLTIKPVDDTGIVGDGITSNRRPRFIGTTEPNASVVLYSASDLSTPLGQSVQSDASGAFEVQLPSDLRNGQITVVARARDAAGNLGPFGTPFTATIITVDGDYNGDGKADLTQFLRGSQSQWLIQGVTSGTPFGVGTLDVPIQGDFNGDGKADLAYYRPSTAQWFVQGIFSGVQYGQGYVDIPAPADYFGTGTTTLATFRPTTGEWFIPNYPGGIPVFGTKGDIPVPGDYDGTGRAQIAVYRPSTGEFFIAGHGAPIQLGSPGQIPVPAAYDNSMSNRKLSPAVYNPTTGVLTILGANNQTRTVQFTPGSIPAPGDYSGAGIAEPAAFNPANNTWTIYTPGSGQSRTENFGVGTGVVVAAPYSYRKVPVPGDYSGVGHAQDVLFRPTSPQAQWFIAGVTGASGIPFGNGATDIPLMADFNGDGKADLALYRSSTAEWFVQGLYPNGVGFGFAGVDLPAPADYYGTGAAVPATFRPTTGEWFISGSSNVTKLGQQGDTPVPADYDGDGTADIAVFQPARSGVPTRWLIVESSTGATKILEYGGRNDIPVPGRYYGSGQNQLAVFRPGTAEWFIAGIGTPVQFGGKNDIPAPADYDGDGKTDIAVYRPATGQLFIAGRSQPLVFGGTKDIPVNAPLFYRNPANRISASSVPTNLDFGGLASSFSSPVASPATPAVSSQSVSPSPTTSTPAPAPTPVANARARRVRPNQSIQVNNGVPKPLVKPLTRTQATQLHDSALANLLARLARRGKRLS